VYSGKPIIGITGGIGSGKSVVARLFGELGCLVIDSDEQAHQAYQDPDVRQTLRDWWGDKVFLPDGNVNRKAIGEKIFADSGQRKKLEGLVHPRVAMLREIAMMESAKDAQVVAYVWDTPLLFETGLNRTCDALVFVQAPEEIRFNRVKQSRGWNEAELRKRENLQWPLDKKREISDYVVDNTADAEYARGQVREVLFRILARR
jgi:dephospho-CoA kinase